MTRSLFAYALGDYLRPVRLVVWFVIALAALAIASQWHRLSGAMPEDVAYGQLSNMVVYRIVALAAAIFATMVVGAEIENRTITYYLTRPIPRWKLLLARLAAAMLATTLVTLLTLLAVGIGFLGTPWNSPLFWRDAWVVSLGAMVYTALFGLVGLVLSRPLIYSLLFAFGWEMFVPNVSGNLYYLSIFTYLRSLANHPRLEQKGLTALLSGQFQVETAPMGASAIVLVAVLVLALGLGVLVFTHFEFMPKEEGA